MAHTRTDNGDDTLVTIEGTLDALTAPELRPTLDAIVAEGRKTVTLDLSNLRLIDSSGVGALVSLLKRVRAYSGEVRISGLRDQPLAIFKLLQLNRVFPGSPERDGPMRVLCVTRIFPNRVEPSFGPYNQKQLAALSTLGWEVSVINPIPWFPGAGILRGKTRASISATVPKTDTIANLSVIHPRFLHVPRIVSVHAPLYAAGVFRDARKLRGRYDVILSPFAYPDGVASILLGELLDVPVVVKLHGGDMNVAAKAPPVGRWIRWGFGRVSRIVAVSYPLAESAHSFGVPWSRLVVVEDGVDSHVFRIRDKAEAKREAGLDPARKHIVYVGRLERRKGVYELMDAFTKIAASRSDVDLVLVGDGEDTEACRSWAKTIEGRVVFTGTLGIDDVARFYAASDVTTLPSYAEGTPNCVIEALACGRPVVATAVGGVPDMIHDERMGELVPVKDVEALVAALERSLDRRYDPNLIVRLTGRGTWADSAKHLADVLQGAVERP